MEEERILSKMIVDEVEDEKWVCSAYQDHYTITANLGEKTNLMTTTLGTARMIGSFILCLSVSGCKINNIAVKGCHKD